MADKSQTASPAKDKSPQQKLHAPTMSSSAPTTSDVETDRNHVYGTSTPLQARSSLTTIYEGGSEASSHSSPDASNIDATLLSVEDEEHFGENFDETQYGCTNELEDGYEDEDDSMELSDDWDDDETQDQHDPTHNNLNLADGVTDERDTKEDVMNVASKVVTPAPELQLSYSADEEAASEETKKIKRRRAELEQAVHQELLVQTDQAARDATREDSSSSVCNDRTLPFKTTSEPGVVLSELNITTPTSSSNQRHSSKTTPQESASAQDTPFTKTLKYFKHHGKNKENQLNVHARGRRNASLPEEITDLSREAANQDEDLEKYRAMDLTPLETVMESAHAGDLITLATPPSAKSVQFNTRPRGSSFAGLLVPTHFAFGNGYMGESGISELVLDEAQELKAEGEISKEEEDDESGESSSVSEEGSKPLQSTSLEDAETTKEYTSTTEISKAKGGSADTEYPTFIKVIGLIPGVLFWNAAATVANATSKTYDTLIEKLTGLGV